MDSEFYQSDIYTYLVLLVIIFLARICDVTLRTIRMILVSKGQKKLVPYLGFVEVLIWILAISQIMQNLNNPLSYFAYAGGFAVVTYVGMMIEEKLALGNILVRIITQKDATDLIGSLKHEGYGTTFLEVFIPKMLTPVPGILTPFRG